MTDKAATTNSAATAIVQQLKDLYATSVANLQQDLHAYLDHRQRPSRAARDEGRYAYPRLTVVWKGIPDSEDEAAILDNRHPQVNRAFARFSRPGTYTSSITRPDLFGSFI